MAIKYYDKYPQRWESPSNDYPQGAFKNLSALGEQDGSYLEKDWLNDQAGFFGALLRNAEMTPNGLVDTAQKSQFYEALIAVASRLIDTKISTKQDKLTFVGDGQDVMKIGAFGIGRRVDDRGIINANNYVGAGSRFTYARGSELGYAGAGTLMQNAHWAGMNSLAGSYNHVFFGFGKIFYGYWNGSNVVNLEFFTTNNTRTDKNNVLHAGTTTPINTLNVSDMSQEVINNDLLTVTSGAVYRALQSKADLTYATLAQKGIVQLTSTIDDSEDKAATPKMVNDVNSKIPSGVRDVFLERAVDTSYTNNSNKIRWVMVSDEPSHNTAPALSLWIDYKQVIHVSQPYGTGASSSITFPIPAGATYKVTSAKSLRFWYETE